MSETGAQNAGLVLAELEEDSRYKALAESGADTRFNAFRQRIELARRRCQAFPSSRVKPDEIRGLLQSLQAECTGTLAPFRPSLEKALKALDG